MPEERLGRGAVPEMSLADNALLTAYDAGLVRHGLVNTAATETFARDTIAQFAVKCGSEHSLARTLSGGNLQKFIVGRETRLQPKVMVVAQPTWGVDIGASQLIRQSLHRLAQSRRRRAGDLRRARRAVFDLRSTRRDLAWPPVADPPDERIAGGNRGSLDDR